MITWTFNKLKKTAARKAKEAQAVVNKEKGRERDNNILLNNL